MMCEGAVEVGAWSVTLLGPCRDLNISPLPSLHTLVLDFSTGTKKQTQSCVSWSWPPVLILLPVSASFGVAVIPCRLYSRQGEQIRMR